MIRVNYLNNLSGHDPLPKHDEVISTINYRFD